MPCTNIERTLIDLASVWDEGKLADAWDGAVLDHKTTIARLVTTALPMLGRGNDGSALVPSHLQPRADGTEPNEDTLDRIRIVPLLSACSGEARRRDTPPPSRALRSGVHAPW